MQGEYEVDWANLWMEVGGASFGRRRGTGAIESGIFFPLFGIALAFLTALLLFYG